MALLSFEGSPHGGALKLLPEWDKQPRIKPVGIVSHTIVGSGLGAYYYFRDLTGTESTFIIFMSGVIWQLMDTERTADAQVAGNYFMVGGQPCGLLSIEHEDDGTPADTPFTAAQVASNIWLHNKLARVHGIARRKCTSPTGPGAAGAGYHSMWGFNTSTNKTINPWTTAAGKGCPDPPRIRQWNEQILPAFVSGTIPQEDTLSAAEVDQIVKAINSHTDDVYRLSTLGKLADGTISAAHRQVSTVAIREVVDRIAGQLSPLAAIHLAQEAIRAEQAVSGDREAKALALLAEIEADLPEPTPEPAP